MKKTPGIPLISKLKTLTPANRITAQSLKGPTKFEKYITLLPDDDRIHILTELSTLNEYIKNYNILKIITPPNSIDAGKGILLLARKKNDNSAPLVIIKESYKGSSSIMERHQLESIQEEFNVSYLFTELDMASQFTTEPLIASISNAGFTYLCQDMDGNNIYQKTVDENFNSRFGEYKTTRPILIKLNTHNTEIINIYAPFSDELQFRLDNLYLDGDRLFTKLGNDSVFEINTTNPAAIQSSVTLREISEIKELSDTALRLQISPDQIKLIKCPQSS